MKLTTKSKALVGITRRYSDKCSCQFLCLRIPWQSVDVTACQIEFLRTEAATVCLQAVCASTTLSHSVVRSCLYLCNSKDCTRYYRLS
jgi:hypothetical protein